MKRIVCAAYGAPDVVRLVESPDEAPRPGEVVVRVGAAGVNYVDALMIAGTYQIKVPPPFTPGSEIAGTVVAVGSNVTGVSAGDRVVAFCGLGGYASHVRLSAQSVVACPAEVDTATAAAVVQSYSTAVFALRDRAQLRADDVVAVAGAAGGVGLACIDVARAAGARVGAVASSAAKRDAALAAGADEAFDANDPELKARLRAFGATVVVDPVGGALSEVALRALAWGGRLVVIGFPAGVARLPTNLTLLNNRAIVGVDWGAWALRNPDSQRDLLRDVLEQIAHGRLRGPTVAPWPLADAARALNALLDRVAIGKQALIPD